ncbi:MAG: deoxyribonuclease IV [Phycisphaerae bacterium]|nr:deoxyribonuclease IV [Phycisphaerae bacterium]
MFGSHLSIAGGMHLALEQAASLGLDCVQVFTKNQQQWSAPPLDAEAVRRWKDAMSRMGWTDSGRAVSHASYLANMASAEPALRAKSIDLMRQEIDRCETLGIGLLVFHPGAHTTAPRADGVARIIDACAELIRATEGYRTVLCLENVAGQGSTIGREFEELAALRAGIVDASGRPDRVGFCIDSCHAHAAGYDLSTRQGAASMLDALDRACGLASVRVLHLNDSKAPAGSRVDRHEHIGRGTIGLEGFEVLVRHPALRSLPKIMETPKGSGPDGRDHDAVNVAALRALAAGAATVPGLVQVDPAKPPAPARPSRARAASKRPVAARKKPRAKGTGMQRTGTPQRGTIRRRPRARGARPRKR